MAQRRRGARQRSRCAVVYSTSPGQNAARPANRCNRAERRRMAVMQADREGLARANCAFGGVRNHRLQLLRTPRQNLLLSSPMRNSRPKVRCVRCCKLGRIPAWLLPVGLVISGLLLPSQAQTSHVQLRRRAQIRGNQFLYDRGSNWLDLDGTPARCPFPNMAHLRRVVQRRHARPEPRFTFGKYLPIEHNRDRNQTSQHSPARTSGAFCEPERGADGLFDLIVFDGQLREGLQHGKPPGPNLWT